MIDYRGQTALVTGAASGIGKALATALAERGATVVMADVNEAALREAAGEIGAKAHVIPCDLADPASTQGLIAQAYARTGRLDLICSNAGMGHGGRVAKEPFDEAALKRLFEVNLFAGMRFAQSYLARLTAEGATGRILFTASENSLSVPDAVRRRFMPLYAATKHSLLIAAEWMREEFAGGPLSLHVLMPGAVYTPMISRGLPDPKVAPPELELIMPEECAARALKGVDLGLFYIPTQPHLFDDMRPRYEGVRDALTALGLKAI